LIMDQPMADIRQLNIDDLYLMKLLLEQPSLTECARQMKLTQPAATQRVRKIEGVFNLKLFERSGRNIILTVDGKAICQRASASLAALRSSVTEKDNEVLNVGSRFEVGQSWLWPAVDRFHTKHKHATVHCHFGSGEEILRMLGTGQLDAVLTSAPVTLRDFDAIEVAKEEYVFVATPEITQDIRKFEDLEQFTLIEHDRGFPFQRYVNAHIRPKLRFKDVLFIGSSVLMCTAAEHGRGVAIVPAYLAQSFLKAKKLAKIRLDLKLDHDYFRLIYTRKRNVLESVRAIAKDLESVGLQ